MHASTSSVLLGLILATACERTEQSQPVALSASAGSGPSSSASFAPSASAVPQAVAPPTRSRDVSFETADGVSLAGTYYDAGDEAPLLVFAHRFRGDRSDWTPVARVLATSAKRYSMVNFDMRGHGTSIGGSGAKRLTWTEMGPDDIGKLVVDVHAAIRFGVEQSGGKAPAVVLAGSSLGAALVSAAAGEDARVNALALVSPGGSIMGFDLYQRFAEVRKLPAFIACAAQDNVCRDPRAALGQMGGDEATVKQYAGGAHGAGALLESAPTLSEDLESFLVSVYDQERIERHTRPPAFEQADKKGK